MHDDARTLTVNGRSLAGARPAIPSSGSGTPGAIPALALALIAIALPVLFHLVVPALAIGACVVLGLLIASFAASTTIVVLIFAYLFQNLFVALVSPQFTGIDQLNAIRAYNFVMTAAIWLAGFHRRVLAGAQPINRRCA